MCIFYGRLPIPKIDKGSPAGRVSLLLNTLILVLFHSPFAWIGHDEWWYTRQFHQSIIDLGYESFSSQGWSSALDKKFTSPVLGCWTGKCQPVVSDRFDAFSVYFSSCNTKSTKLWSDGTFLFFVVEQWQLIMDGISAKRHEEGKLLVLKHRLNHRQPRFLTLNL